MKAPVCFFNYISSFQTNREWVAFGPAATDWPEIAHSTTVLAMRHCYLLPNELKME